MIAWCALAFGAEISGVATGPDGPVGGATIVVYDLRLHAALGLTDSQGRFAIEVDPGEWRIRVIPAQTADLYEVYAPGEADLCAASRYPVPGSTVGVQLARGGSLSGSVVDAAGNPRAGVEIAVEPLADTVNGLDDDGDGLVDEGALALDARTAITGADGSFQVTGLLPTAAFTVEASADDLPDQYFPGVYSVFDAESAVVAATFAPGAGHAETGTATLLEGVRVSGTVRADGALLEVGTAQVYVPSQLRSVSVSGGTYEAAGLPVGDVLVWAIAPGFGTTYFPDADRPGERVSAEDEGARVALDLAMPPESRLEGRLPGNGPFTGTAVVAYNSDRSVGVGAVTDPDGRFAIGSLHGGTYSLAIYAEEAGLVSGVLSDGAVDRAFVVPSQGVLDAGVLVVPEAGAIRGVVQDRSSGEGIDGAYVHAESRTSGALTTATTDGDGAYALLGLSPDDYELWVDYTPVCPEDPDWLARWYPDNSSGDFAGAVTVQAGGEVEWDVAIAADFDHDGMDDAWEVEHGLDPTRDDSAEDPDGDGFTNLEEYGFGTNPQGSADGPGGCGCASTGLRNLWPLVGLAAMRRRRSR